MLEELTQRVENRIPQAINSPIPESHTSHYWSRRMEEFTNVPDFEQVRGEYELASVSFSYQELCELSDEEFLLLQQQLQTTITSSFAQKEKVVPENVASFLKPGDKKNVLIHEKEHIGALPEEIRKKASIDIVVQSDSEGQITIDGISVYYMNKTTDAEKASSFSAPQSLSETDIGAARAYAQRTKDDAFIKIIEQKIEERDQH